MAEISSPRLAITTDEHNADCQVTCLVKFGSLSEAGQKWVLHATLYEKDLTRNQLVVYFTSQFLPIDREHVVTRQPMRFGALVTRGRLNKDIGKDEIFARLDLCRITASRVVRVVRVDTNIVRRRF